MATLPMAPMPEAPEGEDERLCVEICVMADGTITVGMEDQPEPVESIEMALEKAKELLGQGETADPMIEGEQEAMDSFTQGFKQIRGTPTEQMGRRGNVS